MSDIWLYLSLSLSWLQLIWVLLFSMKLDVHQTARSLPSEHILQAEFLKGLAHRTAFLWLFHLSCLVIWSKCIQTPPVVCPAYRVNYKGLRRSFWHSYHFVDEFYHEEDDYMYDTLKLGLCSSSTWHIMPNELLIFSISIQILFWSILYRINTVVLYSTLEYHGFYFSVIVRAIILIQQVKH